MSSTRTHGQLYTATSISLFVQCQVSFRLLPASVDTFMLIEIFLRQLQCSGIYNLECSGIYIYIYMYIYNIYIYIYILYVMSYYYHIMLYYILCHLTSIIKGCKDILGILGHAQHYCGTERTHHIILW